MLPFTVPIRRRINPRNRVRLAVEQLERRDWRSGRPTMKPNKIGTMLLLALSILLLGVGSAWSEPHDKKSDHADHKKVTSKHVKKPEREPQKKSNAQLRHVHKKLGQTLAELKDAGPRDRPRLIRQSEQQLQQLKRELEGADHDYGGHRVDSIKAIDGALHQLKLASGPDSVGHEENAMRAMQSAEKQIRLALKHEEGPPVAKPLNK
jgi:hypothetical protein